MNELSTIEVKDLSPEQLGGEIRLLTQQARRMAVSFGIQIGYRLHIAHEKVGPHGWAEWLRKETDFSAAAASRFESLYEGYGEDQGSLFGVGNKFPTLENLSISNALRLLSVPAEEREEVAQELDAEHMSARELDKALKERDAARKQLQDTSSRLEDTQKRLAVAFDVETELRRKLVEAQQDVVKADEMAEQNERELKARIKELETRPVEVAVERDEKAIEEAVQVATAKTSAEWAEKMKKLQADLDKANSQKEKLKAKAESAGADADQKIAAAEAETARIRQEMEQLRKQLKTSDANVAAFGIHFKAIQEAYNSMVEKLLDIDQNDKETAEKLRGGARVLLGKMLEQIGGAA